MIPVSEFPPPVTYMHTLLQSVFTISGVRVEKDILAKWQASLFIQLMFIEHLLDAGHC